MERGEQGIGVDHLEVASAALGIEPAAFFTDEPAPRLDPTPPPPPIAAPTGLSSEALAVARIIDSQGTKAAVLYLLAGLRDR